MKVAISLGAVETAAPTGAYGSSRPPHREHALDYRALAELVMMSMLGLSTLIFAAGLSIRLFLAPTLRELFKPRSESPNEQRLLAAQLDRIEERLEGLEGSVERISAGAEFDRQLEGPKLG